MPTYHKRVSCFNTQPPEGGWVVARLRLLEHEVSTHSRLKAAVGDLFVWYLKVWFQHTAA